MRYQTAPGVILTDICGRFFLVTPKEHIEVNETTALYWEKLEDGASLDSLCAYAKEIFETDDMEGIREDIRGLLMSLMKKRLLVRCTT